MQCDTLNNNRCVSFQIRVLLSRPGSNQLKDVLFLILFLTLAYSVVILNLQFCSCTGRHHVNIAHEGCIHNTVATVLN